MDGKICRQVIRLERDPANPPGCAVEVDKTMEAGGDPAVVGAVDLEVGVLAGHPIAQHLHGSGSERVRLLPLKLRLRGRPKHLVKHSAKLSVRDGSAQVLRFHRAAFTIQGQHDPAFRVIVIPQQFGDRVLMSPSSAPGGIDRPVYHFDAAEIGQRFGIPEGTLSRTLHNGLELIRGGSWHGVRE